MAPGLFDPKEFTMTGTQIRQLVAWIVAALSALYMLPWAIAEQRRMPNNVAIALLNLLLGWTIVGWFAALFMACGNANQVAPAQTIVINNTNASV